MIARLDPQVLPPSTELPPRAPEQKECKVWMSVALPESHREKLELIAEAECRTVAGELQWLVAMYIDARSDLIEIARQRRERGGGRH